MSAKADIECIQVAAAATRASVDLALIAAQLRSIDLLFECPSLILLARHSEDLPFLWAAAPNPKQHTQPSTNAKDRNSLS